MIHRRDACATFFFQYAATAAFVDYSPATGKYYALGRNETTIAPKNIAENVYFIPATIENSAGSSETTGPALLTGQVVFCCRVGGVAN